VKKIGSNAMFLHVNISCGLVRLPMNKGLTHWWNSATSKHGDQYNLPWYLLINTFLLQINETRQSVESTIDTNRIDVSVSVCL
jgi:hypothetical protein